MALIDVNSRKRSGAWDIDWFWNADLVERPGRILDSSGLSCRRLGQVDFYQGNRRRRPNTM